MPKNLAYEDDLLYEEIDAETEGVDFRDEDEEYDPLQQFLEDGTITEVIGELKSGKEGTVYCCRPKPGLGVDLIAAKLFRSREERTFRNQSIYREGFVILNQRDKRALKKKTAYGRTVEYGTWMNHEYETMRLLFKSGADVPRPIRMSDRVLLMEYVGAESDPAPKLQETTLDRSEAQSVFDRIMRNVELFLATELVHGDLSPYNILYWHGDITVIDFPQAVDPRKNRNAQALLARDIRNVCQYFRRYGLNPDPDGILRNLWGRYSRSQL